MCLVYLYWQFEIYFRLHVICKLYLNLFHYCSRTLDACKCMGDDLTLDLLASLCWGSNPDKVKDAWKCKGEQLMFAESIKTMSTYNTFLQTNINGKS